MESSAYCVVPAGRFNGRAIHEERDRERHQTDGRNAAHSHALGLTASEVRLVRFAADALDLQRDVLNLELADDGRSNCV